MDSDYVDVIWPKNHIIWSISTRNIVRVEIGVRVGVRVWLGVGVRVGVRVGVDMDHMVHRSHMI